MGESRQVSFPTAHQESLPAYSPHCPFNAERQAVNTKFRVFSLIRLGIEPESTAPEADALSTRLSELLITVSEMTVLSRSKWDVWLNLT